ncbi:hypothetical protein LA080_005883 [Diaporthe eres]|nr:hypothetical protein LA080_005883 [Diaporthe eres]
MTPRCPDPGDVLGKIMDSVTWTSPLRERSQAILKNDAKVQITQVGWTDATGSELLDWYQKTLDITDIAGKAPRVMREGALTVKPSWKIIFDYGERSSQGRSDMRVRETIQMHVLNTGALPLLTKTCHVTMLNQVHLVKQQVLVSSQWNVWCQTSICFAQIIG